MDWGMEIGDWLNGDWLNGDWWMEIGGLEIGRSVDWGIGDQNKRPG